MPAPVPGRVHVPNWHCEAGFAEACHLAGHLNIGGPARQIAADLVLDGCGDLVEDLHKIAHPMQSVDLAEDRKRPDGEETSASVSGREIHAAMKEVASDRVNAICPGRFEMDQRGLPRAIGDVLEGGERDADQFRSPALGGWCHGQRSTKGWKVTPAGRSSLAI